MAVAEAALLDLSARFRVAGPPEDRVTVVAIDEASIDRLGRWPWSRTLLAQAIDTLHEAGVALVAVDLLLTEAESAQTDAVLAGSIAAASPALLPVTAIPDDATAPPAWLRRSALGRLAGDSDALPQAGGLHWPIPLLGQAAAGLGHVNVANDAAGALREDVPVMRVGDELYPSFALEAVRLFRNVARDNVIVRPGVGIELGSVFLPTDSGTRLMVDAGPSSRITVVSFADLLDGRVPPQALAGRAVIIGATASGLGDRFSTPFGWDVPGVMRHAIVVSSLLDGRVLRHDDVTLAVDAVLTILACLAVGVAGRRSVRRGLAAAGAGLLILLATDAAALLLAHWWLDAVLPVVALLLIATIALTVNGASRAIELRRLRTQTRVDPLTGLANRNGVRAWLRAASGSRHLVCVGDLDGFKSVNDTLGHPAGDALLQAVGTRLRQCLRNGDLVARLGGDEFLILLQAPSSLDDGAALDIARTALARVLAPYDLRQGSASVGMSFGVALSPDHGANWPDVLNLADEALYAAKRAGKSCIFRAEPSSAPTLIARLPLSRTG